MWWLSFVGPLVAALVYALTGRPDRRREREIERWCTLRSTGRRRKIEQDATAYRGGKEVEVTEADPGRAPRRVTSLPGALARALLTTGGGERIAVFELAPKLAYLAVMGADPTQGSDHVTVVAKLDETGPTLTVRPLPIEEGSRIPNTGVRFEKDPELTASILIEPAVDGSPTPVTAVAEAPAEANPQVALAPPARRRPRFLRRLAPRRWQGPDHGLHPLRPHRRRPHRGSHRGRRHRLRRVRRGREALPARRGRVGGGGHGGRLEGSGRSRGTSRRSRRRPRAGGAKARAAERRRRAERLKPSSLTFLGTPRARRGQ